MHLAELKQKSIGELNEIARDLKIDGAPNLRKQELIFSILQGQTEKNGVIFGEGVLETLSNTTSLPLWPVSKTPPTIDATGCKTFMKWAGKP